MIRKIPNTQRRQSVLIALSTSVLLTECPIAGSPMKFQVTGDMFPIPANFRPFRPCPVAGGANYMGQRIGDMTAGVPHCLWGDCEVSQRGELSGASLQKPSFDLRSAQTEFSHSGLALRLTYQVLCRWVSPGLLGRSHFFKILKNCAQVQSAFTRGVHP